MKTDEIVGKVKALRLSKGSYVVFGSCPLAVANLREARDIDLLVTEEVFEQLKQKGWRELVKSPDDKPLTFDVFEAHSNWNFSTYNPTLSQLLESATIIDGIPFASLMEVRKWKTASNRPKDRADIALIDRHLEKISNKKQVPAVPCPCCGYLTLTEPDYGSFEICPVCFWEDDNIQYGDPDYEGGANHPSLNQARQNFKQYGADSFN